MAEGGSAAEGILAAGVETTRTPQRRTVGDSRHNGRGGRPSSAPRPPPADATGPRFLCGQAGERMASSSTLARAAHRRGRPRSATRLRRGSRVLLGEASRFGRDPGLFSRSGTRRCGRRCWVLTNLGHAGIFR
jgi:hypothetical protein